MESILVMAVTGFVSVTLVRMALQSVGIFGKWALSALCGFLCLWLLNTAAPVTGIALPVNAVTVAMSATLGLPGIALLAVLAVI